MVKNVVKRDGRLVEFNSQKIVAAILKAMDVTEQGEDIVLAAKIADAISKQAPDKLGVEDIQDLVELELMKSPRKEVARKYIAYRNQRNLARKAKHERRYAGGHDDEVRLRGHQDLCGRVSAVG